MQVPALRTRPKMSGVRAVLRARMTAHAVLRAQSSRKAVCCQCVCGSVAPS